MTVKFSRKSILLPAVFLIGLLTVGPDARAASINKVLSACDRTAGCNYKINKAGDITGCSKKTCFYCPNDGKRKCFAVGKRLPEGNRAPVLTNPVVNLE